MSSTSTSLRISTECSTECSIDDLETDSPLTPLSDGGDTILPAPGFTPVLAEDPVAQRSHALEASDTFQSAQTLSSPLQSLPGPPESRFNPICRTESTPLFPPEMMPPTNCGLETIMGDPQVQANSSQVADASVLLNISDGHAFFADLIKILNDPDLPFDKYDPKTDTCNGKTVDWSYVWKGMIHPEYINRWDSEGNRIHYN
ncbi:hypothetical protein A0H81_14367 [Grifola frondosa]|uniref:Uncharacterized protein n=1 Tax=Grifola frondosa TaxID=5627 RepID=A0A1C7LNW4_GRIFR|nr:hypothetical protein A0H81_14367 [Grifola frondosa]